MIDIKYDLNKKINYKGKTISYGRKLFNECLPEDYPLIDEVVDKKRLIEILNDIVLNYPPNISIETLDKVKELGFTVSTEVGNTLSFDELYDEKLMKFSDSLKDEDGVQNNMKKINNDKNINSIIQSKPCYNFIKSGARGSVEQLRQLILSRGYIADMNNKIIPKIVKSSLIKGLTPDEFFMSSYGSRKGLMDTAVSTSASGYLTRQLIYSTVNTELDTELDDCGTQDCLELLIYVKDKDGKLDENATDKLAKSLIWRYISVNGDKPYLITKNNYKALIGRKIKLRSPIFCKGKHICKTCYGNLHKILHSNQIGIIATQAIGERSTQMVLRSFHTSGGVSNTNEDESNKDIISGISVLNKLLHRPFEVLKTNDVREFVIKFHSLFSDYGSINMVHFETIISSIMFTDDGRKWRTLKNRNNFPYKFESILKTPTLNSWLLGVCFSRLKSKLLDGMVDKRVDIPNSISKLFRL